VTESTIWGCEFTQQDGLIGVCAHACLHSVSRFLHEHYGSDVLSFGEIGDRAECHDASEGLTSDQMVAVLESLDCQVFRLAGQGTIESEDENDIEATGAEGGDADFGDVGEFRAATVPFLADEVIYRYIESELPVIALIKIGKDYHTLFVVGHSFERESWWPEARDGYYPQLGENEEWLPSSLWSNSFYLLDDNYGPYMSMPRDVCRERVIELLIPIPNQIEMKASGEAVESQDVV
jgi:hypothetical protein